MEIKDVKGVIIQCTPAVTVNIPVTDELIYNEHIVITMDELYNPEYATIDSQKISPETREVISRLKGEKKIEGTNFKVVGPEDLS